MDNNQNIPASDFSDIPALGDVKGLEAYMNNQALAAQGLPVQPAAPAAQPTVPATQPAATTVQGAQGGQPAPQPAAQPAAAPSVTPDASGNVTLSREQYAALLAGRGLPQQPAQPTVPQAQVQAQPVQQAATRTPMYSAQEQAFISKALAQGYSLDQINRYLAGRSAQSNPVMEQRIAQVEQYLKQQEYKAAETAFVNKLSSFGDKWGLSEADLVTFGNEALKHGINIAGENVDLETVFRAVYPDQYSIRLRRMTPTPTSQIYGGTSIPEGNRATAAKVEDAYVEAFLKGAMPNQYAAFKK